MSILFPEMTRVLCDVLPAQLTKVQSFEALMTENVLFEFPYAPEGSVRRLDGRDALRTYLLGLAKDFVIDRLEVEHVFVDPTGRFATLEMSLSGKLFGEAYRQNYVSVLTLRDGMISRYRDYWNPLALPSAEEEDT